MAKKRFTDIEIWNKEWFMNLSPKLKCLVRYLFDCCDPSGVWTPNWKLATVHIGEDVSIADVKMLPGDQYEILENGKIFLPDFISFQYGTLSQASPAHKPIFQSIEKNKISDRVFNRVGNRVSNTLQEKETDKEIDQDITEGGTGETEPELNQGYLTTEMVIQWQVQFPHYLIQKENDLPAVGGISQAICKELKLKNQPGDPEIKNRILKRWGEVTAHIAQDGFYQKFSLSQVNKNFQSIIQSINANGRTKNSRGTSTDTSRPGTRLSGI
jgi:hypothetical protein